MTIFAGVPAEPQTTLWDRICGQPSSSQMMKSRRAENDTALTNTGARIVNLSFLDAQYQEAPVSIAQLADAITANSPDDAVYLAPLTGSYVRRHSDHVLVRDAALELMRQGKRVTFYPDAPYMHLPRKPATGYIQRLSMHAGTILGHQAVTVHLNSLSPTLKQGKQRAMRAYASQWRMTNIVSFNGLSRLAHRDYEIILEPNGNSTNNYSSRSKTAAPLSKA